MKGIKNYEEKKQNETRILTINNNNIKTKNNINEEKYNDLINILSKDNNIKKKKDDLILNLENEIESILINIYNNRYSNYKKKDLSLSNKAYQFFNELKNYCFKSNKDFSFNILKILLKKIYSLINYIEENIDYENININEIKKIKDCVKNSGNDIEKIFEPALKKIDKSFDIENILLGIFIKVIVDKNDIIFKIIEKEDENIFNDCKDENEYIEFENYLTNENDKNNSFENHNFDFNDEEEKENENENENEIILNNYNNSNINDNKNNNNNNLNNSNFKNNIKDFDIDKFVDYINEGDNIKKNKKKKKKNKKNKNDNLIKFNNDNINNESDDIDPIVDNFKQSLNIFSDNVNNIKIRPTFSKKWLKKIEL